MLQPLHIEASRAPVASGVVSNIAANCRRGLQEFFPVPVAHDGTFVLVGSGPSLAGFADEIRAEQAKGRPICAIKGAHDWLCDQGITPDVYFTIDPRDRRNGIQRKNAHTLYVISSRCDAVMLDHLKDCWVMLVHCISSEEENQWFKDSGKYLLGGMSTSGLRALNFAYELGYRKVIMFGMDSCNAPDGITKRVDGSLTGQTVDVHVQAGGRKFICNVAMAKQAEDFQNLFRHNVLPGLHIESRGDGLLTEMLRVWKEKGLPT